MAGSFNMLGLLDEGTGAQTMEVGVQFDWWAVSGKKVTFVVKEKEFEGKAGKRRSGMCARCGCWSSGGKETAAHLASRGSAEMHTQAPTRGCAKSGSRPI